jgi:putative NADH-flavin reductase
MHIAIIGASRGVGRAAVTAALAAGHTVTALARSPLSPAPGLTVITGDVGDDTAVRSALSGAGAVLVALGVTPGQRGGTPQDVCSRGTRTVLAAMGDAGIDRLVVVTSYGVGPSKPLTPFPFNIFAMTVLRAIMADKEIQEQEVRTSGTRWTIVQPLGLTDDPPTGRPGTSIDFSRGKSRVSRADVALVCLNALENGTFIGDTVTVSGG